MKAIANDVAIIKTFLEELAKLVDEKPTTHDVFNQAGIDLINHSIQTCKAVFESLHIAARKARSQLANAPKSNEGLINLKLRRSEKVKWPFLQPEIESLRQDPRDAKNTLILVLNLGTLTQLKRSVNFRAMLPFSAASQGEELSQQD